MQDSINLQARNYMGKGNLLICSSAIADCYINIHFRNDGKHSITCWIYLTNEYAKNLYDILEKEMSTVVYATFTGEDAEGANISIEKMALDETHFNANSTTNDPKYIIRPELLLNILSKVGLASYTVPVASQNFLNVVRLEFTMHSDIHIHYRQIQDGEPVSSRWGLTNFYFGSESRGDHFIMSNYETLSLKVGVFTIEIKKVLSYFEILSQLKTNNNVDVTCEAYSSINYGELSSFKILLDHVCELISYANSNWVIPLYNDIYKDGKIVGTTLLQHKVYPFVKGRKSVIDVKNASSLQEFVEGTFEKYKNLKSEVGFHKPIEYYLSAETNCIAQERFNIAYIAL